METIITEIDIKTIKCIIGDLDNTFWKGTISEDGFDGITIDEKNIELIKLLSAKGIINSICSKNDFDLCKKKLQEIKIWDYFVFPSIDWTAKAGRVAQLVKTMSLRAENILFLDDEPYNLNSVKAKSSSIMCCTIELARNQLFDQAYTLKDDVNMSRLNRYKILEKKERDKKDYTSDTEFLQQAGITISINKDCKNEIDRIHELIQRTNQLNYTKKRVDKDELNKCIEDKEYDCAYIKCQDNYGEYGIIGFYALDKQNNELKHFLFSCRTIGMGIEQYIYAKLGFPHITRQGEIVTELQDNGCPDWIHEKKIENEDIKHIESNAHILAKGPCDISQIIPFIATKGIIEEEFTYVSKSKKGVRVEGHNHTSQIVLSSMLTDEEKEILSTTIDFIDEEYFKTHIYDEVQNYIILSLVTDYGLGMYQNKKNPQIVIPYEQYTYDITNPECWDIIMDKWHGNLSEDFLKQFKDNWVFIGPSTAEMICSNLDYILRKINPSTKLILINGAEKPFEGKDEIRKNRHLRHIELNKKIREYVEKNRDRCVLIDVNKYITDSSYYLDTINHYKKIIYFNLAKEIIDFIKSDSMMEIKDKGIVKLIEAQIEEKIIHPLIMLVRSIFNGK